MTGSQNRRDLLDAALEYANLDLCVFPLHGIRDGKCTCHDLDCSRQGKHPRTRNGFHGAMRDLEKVREFWARHPDSNIGLPTGAVNQIYVLDIDGDEGRASIKGKHLPITPTCLTGRGCHYYYRLVRRALPGVQAILPGVDLKGDGGYVVAPPSMHYSGKEYEWAENLALGHIDMAEIPEWLERLISLSTIKKNPIKSGGNGIATTEFCKPVMEGRRNDMIAKLTGYLLHRDVQPHVTQTLVLGWNQRHCTPPLDHAEVDRTINSICRLRLKQREENNG